MSGTSLEGVREVGGVTQAETGTGPPSVGAGRSRDPAMMEET